MEDNTNKEQRDSRHRPVLLKETIELLNLKKGDVVVDATLGGGGHSTSILEKISDSGKLVAIDADIDAIERFKSEIKNKKSKKEKNIFLVNDNFANLENILAELEIKKVDAIMADLGWSSDQLIGRGMSFQEDEDLDMRLDQSQELDAKKVVNEYSQEDLERIIRDYGEEKFFKKISRRIIEYRNNKKIKTTGELRKIIERAAGKWRGHGKIHPATRTFQAIRIEVNGELENLKKFIPEAIGSLKTGGRLGVIAFHSLEDRIVKKIFRENARGCIFTDEITGRKIVKTPPVIRIITKKPIVPGERETKENPRARSAKLRVAEKISTNYE
jgi:16S rRNA (cytosine1402-N4)-methyltransferase